MQYCRKLGNIFASKSSNIYNCVRLNQNIAVMSQNMDRIPVLTVKNVESQERIEISVEHLTNDTKRTYNLCRTKSEEVGVSITRLATNIGKVVHKKLKKSNKSAPFPEINIKLLGENGIEIDDSVVNEDAWLHAKTAVIEDAKYKIEINPPEVKLLKLQKYFMAGYKIFPLIELQFATIQDSYIEWYREIKTIEQSNHVNEKEANFEHVFSGEVYTPVNNDIGCRLKVKCTPKSGDRSGNAEEVVAEVAVSSHPGTSPLEKRYLETACVCSENR